MMNIDANDRDGAGLEQKNIALRENLHSLAEAEGWDWKVFSKVKTEGPYSNYSAVFMSAMQPELQWLYHGTPPAEVKPLLSTSFCIRSKGGFSNAGMSNRHLKCFEMLNFAGRMEEEDILTYSFRILDTCVDTAKVTPHVKYHPSDMVAAEFCAERGIKGESDELCGFEYPGKTTRTGRRVEIYLNQHDRDWEVFNLVVLDATDHENEKIQPPLFELSGSIERLLAFSEGRESVFDTSCFDARGTVNHLSNPKTVSAEFIQKIQDLIRPVLVMSFSDFELPASISKASTADKTFYYACHELVMTAWENGISKEAVALLLHKDQDFVSGWCDQMSDQNKFENLSQAIDILWRRFDETSKRIEQYISQNKDKLNSVLLLERAAKRYEGGTKRLTQLVAKKFE